MQVFLICNLVHATAMLRKQILTQVCCRGVTGSIGHYTRREEWKPHRHVKGFDQGAYFYGFGVVKEFFLIKLKKIDTRPITFLTL